MDDTRWSGRRVWVIEGGGSDEALDFFFPRLMKKIGHVASYWIGTPLPGNFLGALGQNGKVYVLGHGSPNNVGNLTLAQVAHGLVTQGGMQGGCRVTLVSCNSAFSKWHFWENSFAKKLKRELVALGADCTVVGRRGGAEMLKTGSVTSTYGKRYY